MPEPIYASIEGEVARPAVLVDDQGVLIPTSTLGLVTRSGPAGIAHNREIAAPALAYASATNSTQWAAGAQPTKLQVMALPATTVTYAAGTLLGYAVINSPNDAYAAAALAQAGSEFTDVPWWPILMNVTTEIPSDFPITRLDVLPTIAGIPIFAGAA